MFVNQYTYRFDTVENETITKPSMTVQGEAYSVQELYEKFSAGQVPSIYRAGTYSDDASFDDPDLRKVNDMDLDERNQFANDLSARIKETERQLEIKAKADAEAKAAKQQSNAATPPSASATTV